jgi:alanine dehydrogenase
MEPFTTRILTRSDVARLLSLPDCIRAVEEVFRLHAQGRVQPPTVLGFQVPQGGFHVKAAGLEVTRPYFAAKINANFPGNPSRHGLPTIQGVIALYDAVNGRPLALMDSIEITIQRTGAATAVAAKYLALADTAVAAICGCGVQGRVQLQAICEVRKIRQVFAVDRDPTQRESFAEAMSQSLGIEVVPVAELAKAARQSGIVVTCTPSQQAILKREDVSPGTFVAGVGADNPEKQELDPALLAGSTVVVDHLEQCLTIGDLHHAVLAGLMTRDDVYAELGEVIAGIKPGRRTDQEIIIFDSTGTALQDVAAAAIVYERAVREDVGSAIQLAT